MFGPQTLPKKQFLYTARTSNPEINGTEILKPYETNQSTVCLPACRAYAQKLNLFMSDRKI
jgi:hypothetical protein